MQDLYHQPYDAITGMFTTMALIHCGMQLLQQAYRQGEFAVDGNYNISCKYRSWNQALQSIP